MDINDISNEQLLRLLEKRLFPRKKYPVKLTQAQRMAMSRAKKKAVDAGLEFNEYDWIRENVE